MIIGVLEDEVKCHFLTILTNCNQCLPLLSNLESFFEFFGGGGAFLYNSGMSRLIFGINPVREALTHIPQQVRVLWIDRDRRDKLGELIDLAQAGRIKPQWVSRRDLDRECGPTAHQGVACRADDFAYTSVKTFLDRQKEGPGVVVVADRLEDPQNLGSMLRAMGAFGAQLLVVGKKRSATVTPAVVKVSAGAAGLIPIARENALAEVLEKLKAAGYWVFGLEADGPSLLADQDLSGRVVLVVGSEGRGLSRLVRARCDQVCRLPLRGPLRSLNAAQALACALYETARQGP